MVFMLNPVALSNIHFVYMSELKKVYLWNGFSMIYFMFDICQDL